MIKIYSHDGPMLKIQNPDSLQSPNYIETERISKPNTMEVKSRVMYHHLEIIDTLVEKKNISFGPFKLNMWIKPLSEYQVTPPSSREAKILQNDQSQQQKSATMFKMMDGFHSYSASPRKNQENIDWMSARVQYQSIITKIDRQKLEKEQQSKNLKVRFDIEKELKLLWDHRKSHTQVTRPSVEVIGRRSSFDLNRVNKYI